MMIIENPTKKIKYTTIFYTLGVEVGVIKRSKEAI